MKRFFSACALLLVSTLVLESWMPAESISRQQRANSSIDRDLTESTITQLRSMVLSGRYTVAQVTRWHLDRIARYDDVYRAFLHVDSAGALATAASLDAARKDALSAFKPGALWGVPIVVKGNTSVKGLVTTDGWQGYRIPGHELTA